MEPGEIERIFHADGYRLAGEYLQTRPNATQMYRAIDRLYEAVDSLIGSFLQRTAAEGRPAMCRKGCDWCCHQAVFAVTHELLYLREHINKELTAESEKQFEEMARRKSELTLQKPVKELQLIKAPCPFLQDHSCQVYAARPMACRIYLSSSESSCKNEYLDPEDESQFPQLYEFPLRAGRMMNEGFVAYLKEQGLHLIELPLEQGYISLLTLEQDMDSWIQS
jgi:Fe-S-cluster containining protein